MIVILAMVLAAIGFVAGWAIGRAQASTAGVSAVERARQLSERVDELNDQCVSLSDQLSDSRQLAAVAETRLQAERQRALDQTQNETRLVAEFDRLSQQSLRIAGEDLMKVAENTFKAAQQQAKSDLDQQRAGIEHLVQPVQDNLTKLEQFMHNSDKERREAQGGLFQQLRDVAEASSKVSEEASSLKNVLRSSTTIRGRWGEVQLRRVVELAGMLEHADFSEQTSVTTDDGRSRADLIINLPGNVHIAVDAKVPFDSFEKAQMDKDVAAQKAHFQDHAKQLKAHVDTLVKRAYWTQYVPTSGFCVLFVPGEALLDAALVHDSSLWTYAAERNVLLATPSTLIALLRMASLGWRQEAQSENTAEIARVGADLHKRLVTALNHVEKLGRNLTSAVGSYNDFTSSLQARVVPSARRLSALGAGDGDLPGLNVISDLPKQLRSFNEAPLELREEIVPMQQSRSAG